MIILGISAFYHDSAASLLIDDKVIACAEEERFTRIKHDSSFPTNAINYCLKEANITLGNINYIVFYDKPFLKFERLLETYITFAPKGFLSFIQAIPIWIKQKLFFKKILRNGLKEINGYHKNIEILFSEHHLSHAASTFFASNYKEAAIITIDGVGEWATTCIYKGSDNTITLLKQMQFPHSIGLLYSAFTYYCGFKVNSGEYKLMGLAPYATPESDRVIFFIKIIKQHLITLYEDGSMYLNQEYFNYATGLTMTRDHKWEKIFKLKRRNPNDALTQNYCDLALAIQLVTEESVVKLVKEAIKLTGIKTICLSGGVALNCVANGRLLKEKIADNIYIMPAAGDAGGSLGAAYAVYYIYLNSKRILYDTYDNLKNAYLGPRYNDRDIEEIIKKYQAVYTKIKDDDILYSKTADLLANGNIIGWFQGRMEFGPRALGNRSILADPRNVDMQKKLNLKIKYRESFRPFAPCVLEEDLKLYFNLDIVSPYMLFVSDVIHSIRKKLPEKFSTLKISDKINTSRSSISAVTHIDYSARIQTVNKKTNERLYLLLHAFKLATNCSVLINTSFNVRGEPIVCSPEDAYLCFMNTEIDYLVINNYLFDKTTQPKLIKEKRKFDLD